MQQEDSSQSINNFKVNLTYPRNDEYEFYTKLERINLDKECDKDLSNRHGFLVKEPQPINKALKSDDSIFSSKFGRSLQDPNPYSNRYSCKCGFTQGSFNAVPNDANFTCPVCHTQVKLVGDDFTYFGWIKLKNKYHVIHPLMYKSLESLIGKDNLESIIEPEVELDGNGKPMSMYDKRIFKKKNTRRFKKRSKIDQTFAGIGMLGFYDHFDEIIDYFYKKKPAKKDVYDDIVANRDIVFTHCIPVYTTQLRIAKVENKRFTFESTNADFNLLAKLAAQVNKDNLFIYRNKKYQNQLLWDMQSKITHLTTEIIAILSGKKGIMRSTISGRVAFTSRTVIVPDPKLHMDEITMPYFALCILLEQVIINILQKSYNITFANAYKIWYFASMKEDPRVKQIIDNLIDAGKVSGIINRNPTIAYGSMVYVRVVKCTEGFTMGMNTWIITDMAADYDGDVLSFLMIYNNRFREECNKVFNPRNAFCISRDDGLLNPSINIFKDTVINLNGLLELTRGNYSKAQLENIERLKKKYPQMVQ